LSGAPGLDPFSTEEFHAWVIRQRPDSSAWHAGHLVLNILGDGPWARFDAIAAVKAFDQENRAVFANWARCWR
jgi:hypothetical protein